MSDNMSASADHQCMQFYQQPLMDDGMAELDPSIEGLFMDATMPSSEGMILSPRNLHNNIDGHLLTPKGCAFKPIRRRTRATSKRSTPTILLKANTSNFRAIVQQFTGCSSTRAMSSFALHKGPITLNFKRGSKQQIQHPHTITRAIMPPIFVGTICSNQVDLASLPWQKQQPEQVPEQELMQEQRSGYWLDHVKTMSNYLPTSGNSCKPISCMDDGFLFDNDFSLHELSVNAISNDFHGLFM